MSTLSPEFVAYGRNGFPRISSTTFTITEAVFLGLAIVTAVSRTALRVYRFHKLELDDICLIMSLLFLCAGIGVVEQVKDLMYFQVELSLGTIIPTEDLPEQILRFEVLNNVATILVWASIFSVKLSFLTFFRKLISRIRYLEIYWWFVLSIVLLLGPICMFFVLYICPNFTLDLLLVCTTADFANREQTYLITTTIMDIVTDLLIISVPVILLWKVRIDLRRKLALGIILSLSAFMIVITIVRISLKDVYGPLVKVNVTDTVWLFFWQDMEASVAIIMVSITAFRSMLGQESARSYGYQKNGGDTVANGRKTGIVSRTRSAFMSTSDSHQVSNDSGVGIPFVSVSSAGDKRKSGLRSHVINITKSADDISNGFEMEPKEEWKPDSKSQQSGRKSQEHPESFV